MNMFEKLPAPRKSTEIKSEKKAVLSVAIVKKPMTASRNIKFRD